MLGKPGILSFSPTSLTLYLIQTPFNAFANREDPDQAALVPDQGLLCLLMEL